MAFEQKPGHGALFPNDKGGNDKRPDTRGTAMLPDGRMIDLSGWKRESQSGKKYLSLAVQFSKPKPGALVSDTTDDSVRQAMDLHRPETPEDKANDDGGLPF